MSGQGLVMGVSGIAEKVERVLAAMSCGQYVRVGKTEYHVRCDSTGHFLTRNGIPIDESTVSEVAHLFLEEFPVLIQGLRS